MLHFYHHPISPYSQKIFFLLEEAGKPYDLQTISIEKREHRSSIYRAVNPAARVPTIRDGDFTLAESNAILRYITRRFELHDFHPIGLREQAEVDHWWEFCSHHINKPLLDLVWHKFLVHRFGGRPEAVIITKAERDLARDLPILEAHLCGRNYLVGPRLTLADVNLIPFAHHANKVLSLDQWPAFARWTSVVSERQAWRNVVAHSG